MCAAVGGMDADGCPPSPLQAIQGPSHCPPNLPHTLPPFRPERGDLVATVAETTGVGALRLLRDRMRADPEGSRILSERPRVTVRGNAACMGGVCA